MKNSKKTERVLELTFPGGHKTKTSINGFEIITDYPLESGGNNEFPKPWDVFLSSVASCHGIHVVTYCMDNGIPYDKIKLTLEYIADENQEGKFTDFIIKDHLPADFPLEHIQPMLDETSRDCWVNRHLAEYDVKVHYNVIAADGSEKSHVIG